MDSTVVLAALMVAVSVGAPGGDPQRTLTNERIFEAIGVRDGSTVCEVGAGTGASTIAAAKAVGTAGRVYSNELSTRVKALRESVERSGLPQITVIEGDVAKTNFPDESCDSLFMRDVYHHFADPASMNRAILAALEPGGRAAIVDFTPPPDSEAPSPADRGNDGMHGINPDTMVRELKEAGFEIVRSDRPEERWFMIVVAKPNQ